MIVSLMVMSDDGEVFAMVRDDFEEKTGYTHRRLFKLYQQCRVELHMKLKKLQELSEPDFHKSKG